jgi:hypothetical protein
MDGESLMKFEFGRRMRMLGTSWRLPKAISMFRLLVGMFSNIIAKSCIDEATDGMPVPPPQGTTSLELPERGSDRVATARFELRNGVLATTQAKFGSSLATSGSDASG